MKCSSVPNPNCNRTKSPIHSNQNSTSGTSNTDPIVLSQHHLTSNSIRPHTIPNCNTRQIQCRFSSGKPSMPLVDNHSTVPICWRRIQRTFCTILLAAIYITIVRTPYFAAAHPIVPHKRSVDQAVWYESCGGYEEVPHPMRNISDTNATIEYLDAILRQTDFTYRKASTLYTTVINSTNSAINFPDVHYDWLSTQDTVVKQIDEDISPDTLVTLELNSTVSYCYIHLQRYVIGLYIGTNDTNDEELREQFEEARDNTALLLCDMHITLTNLNWTVPPFEITDTISRHIPYAHDETSKTKRNRIIVRQYYNFMQYTRQALTYLRSTLSGTIQR